MGLYKKLFQLQDAIKAIAKDATLIQPTLF